MNTYMIQIDRWFASKKVNSMRVEEEGGLLRLLLYAARSEEGSLADDDNELAQLSRLGEAWFEKPKRSSLTRGERIRQCFYEQDGRLFNVCVDEDRAKLERKAQQWSNAGNASVERRRQRKGNGRSTDVEQIGNEKGTDVQRTLSKSATETERTFNSRSTDVGTNTSTNVAPIYSLLSSSTTSSSSNAKADDDERLAQIRQWLSEYTHGAMGECPPDVARKIMKNMGDRPLSDLQELLVGKAEMGLKPRRNFMWFVTMTESAFAEAC